MNDKNTRTPQNIAQVIDLVSASPSSATALNLKADVTNTDRAVGTRLSGNVHM